MPVSNEYLLLPANRAFIAFTLVDAVGLPEPDWTAACPEFLPTSVRVAPFTPEPEIGVGAVAGLVTPASLLDGSLGVPPVGVTPLEVGWVVFALPTATNPDL